MRILKVIAYLLNYPSAEVQPLRGELGLEISDCREISPDMRARLLETVEAIYGGDLMDAQENYGLLFDQGRSLSLHLFEHVHGESRDRGQAMVDLMNVYSNNGYELDALELPDYLPLFLEFLASRSDLEAREWLADVAHILAHLCARLHERDRHYAVLLEALLVIAGQQQLLQESLQAVASEQPDNTPEAIDKEWEETAVTFGAPSSCGVKRKPDMDDRQPLHWVDTPNNPQTATTGRHSS